MAEKAMETFQKMREVFGCEPGVRSYNSLLNALEVSNQLSKAEVFFRNFRSMGVSPILEASNILIKTACQKWEFDKVRELIDCMWDRNLTPDRHGYGTLINGLVKAGDLNEAVKVFEDMSSRGVMPDVMCYNILIDGFCKKGNLMVAGILNKLNKDSHVYPNDVTYNVMISGLCNRERFVEALELFDRMIMNERKMDLFTCRSLIHRLCGLGNMDEAERVYTEMVESKVPPDSVVYNALLSGYQKVDRFEDCFKLWELMGRDGNQNVASSNIMMRGLFNIGAVKEAISIWELLRESSCVADSTTYGILVRGLCENGYNKKALHILEEAEGKCGVLDSFAYSSMISGMCSSWMKQFHC